MSDSTTNYDLVKLEDRIDKRFDELLSVMSQFAQDVDTRFDTVDARFDAVDARFDSADKKADSLDMRLSRVEHDLVEIKQTVVDLQASHDRLLNTIDGFIARIDGYETENAARDRQMERLLEWARKVSKKTGIPLENL